MRRSELAAGSGERRGRVCVYSRHAWPYSSRIRGCGIFRRRSGFLVFYASETKAGGVGSFFQL